MAKQTSAPEPESLLEYVIGEIEKRKGQWPAVAEASGVDYKTMVKIVRREVANPGVLHIEKLAKHFRANPIASTRAA